jgi:hypothetical protein
MTSILNHSSEKIEALPMPANSRHSAKLHPAHSVMAIFGTLLTGALSACADTHWERAIYQGWQYNNPSCGVTRRPADPPCANLPPYEAYVKEREAVRSKPMPNAAADNAAK